MLRPANIDVESCEVLLTHNGVLPPSSPNRRGVLGSDHRCCNPCRYNVHIWLRSTCSRMTCTKKVQTTPRAPCYMREGITFPIRKIDDVAKGKDKGKKRLWRVSFIMSS